MHLTGAALYALACGSLVGVLQATAEDAADNSRGVHIIDAPAPTASPEPTSAPVETAPTVSLGTMQGKIQIANSADLSLQILPGPEFETGSKISFSVTSRKPGYLILVDVDATGKITQIFPNPISLLHARGPRERTNLLKPGRPLRVPDPEDAYAGFEFIATPSGGPSMVVAMLSQRPVQLVDIPDLPASVTEQSTALSYLSNTAADLKIPEGERGSLSGTTWSFDASVYSVRPK
jgi:hypothetical protein